MISLATNAGTCDRSRGVSGSWKRRFNLHAKTIRALLLVFAFLMATPAQADMGCNPFEISKVLTAGVISIPMGATSGQTVATLPPDPFRSGCVFNGAVLSGTVIHELFTDTAVVPGFTDVYPTSIAGLGIRYTMITPDGCDSNNATLSNSRIDISCFASGPSGGVYTYITISVRPSFVVTGTVRPGASSLSTVPTIKFTYFIKDVSGSWPKSPLYTGAATGTLSTATCSVQTAANAVTLPTVSTRSFSGGVGTFSGRQTFNLGFSCASGAQVSIVITDAVDPSNRSNVLTLAPDSTAKGIGVQILRDPTTLVSFGPDAAGPGVVNQWLIGASPSGLLQLPLIAQYIRTGDVQAGSIKALATFTMSYQ